MSNRFHLCYGTALHLQIDCGVPIGRVGTGMSQPLTDRGEVDTRNQKRNSRAVAHAMWVKTFPCESTHIGASALQMFGQDVPNPKASQGLFSMVGKDSHIRAEIQMALLAMIAQNVGSLRPQRTETFFPALTVEPDLKRSDQLEIACSQVNDLLHAAPCVEHCGD